MEFKQWLTLNEGVDVGVSIPPDKRKSESKDLLELCSELMRHLGKKYKIEFNQIEPDGDDYWKTEGLLNVYVGGLNGMGGGREHMENLVEDAITYLRGKGMQVGKVIKNTWQDAYNRDIGRYNTDPQELKADYSERGRGNLNSIRVYRIPVKMNQNLIKSADMPPDLNMGFDTARAVFEMIFDLPSGGTSPMGAVIAGLSGQPQAEPSGEWQGWVFTADEIIRKYEKLKGDLDLWAGLGAREPEKWKDEHGPQFYDFGVDKDRIMRRAKDVYELAKWAKARGYNGMWAA